VFNKGHSNACEKRTTTAKKKKKKKKNLKQGKTGKFSKFINKKLKVLPKLKKKN
jgi:hypothetical protein